MKYSGLAALALALACAAPIGAADPAVDAPDAVKRELALKQQALARQYGEFEQAILRLTSRLEKSSKEEDRARAAQLKKAIELAGKEDVRGKFDRLILTLGSSPKLNLQEIQDVMKQQKMLATDVRGILALLMDDGAFKKSKEQMITLRKILQELDRAIRDQKLVRVHTESQKVEQKELGNLQVRVTDCTVNVARLMGVADPGKAILAGPAANGSMKSAQLVVEATQSQRDAYEKISRGDNARASTHQDQSVSKLLDARKQLEAILRQLREEEIERVLAALQARCERMLEMQLAVFSGTIETDAAIAKNADKKPTRADEQRSIELSKHEDLIVQEVNKTIQLLETEGTAVAFPEVFTQLRDDMRHVSRRLGNVDVGSVTQVIERDVIGILRELVGVLKKADSEFVAIGTPRPPRPPMPNAAADKEPQLIDPLAELKMVRAMQVRVNYRTSAYGDTYKGEQAKAPAIQLELNNLADRQKRIADVTSNLPKVK